MFNFLIFAKFFNIYIITIYIKIDIYTLISITLILIKYYI